MLNKTVKVRITKPIDPKLKKSREPMLNVGIGDVSGAPSCRGIKTYVMGISYPVNYFVGKIIALLKRQDGYICGIVAAPKNVRFVNYEIIDALEFSEKPGSYKLDCLYENSCGAVVFRKINNVPRFLLIKNQRSAHWGFPKGHMERGETPQDTAKREVLEETGLRINIIEGFSSKSEYIIGRRVQKEVRIFLATTTDTQTKIQKEEIEDYIWLTYEQAMETLNFQNDKRILRKAQVFMLDEGIGYTD